MAIFPKTVTAVNELAMTILNGLDQHAALFPSVTPETQAAFDQVIGSFHEAVNNHTAAKAAAKAATIAKDDAQAVLETEMHKVLKLAENDSAANPENLDYIGWSGRKAPSPLAAPAQPRELEAVKEGPGVLTLKWLKPVGGGAPSSYRVERSDLGGGAIPGPWTILTNCYTPEITLQNQPRGIEMHYRVTATNPSGDSMPSNIATAVL